MPKITVEQAVKALGIDVPVMACRMVGDRMELHLYGGQVVFYPQEANRPDPHPNPLPQTTGEATPARKSRRVRRPKDPHPSPLPERARENAKQ